MSRYAADTSVSAERSRAEIEKTLGRYGATSFMYGWDAERGAVIVFELEGRRIRFLLPMPDRNDKRFTETPTGKVRSPQQAEKEWEQAQRQAWRALNLVVKAKLEAVESGITTFEDEFLAHIMLPDGSTVGQMMAPQLALTYESGAMPKGLPGLTFDGGK